MNPYVFLVGCPRSGTTLVRRIADAHSRLAVMPEQHWLPRFWEARVGMTDEGLVTTDLIDWLLSDRRFELLELPLRPLTELIDNGPPLSYAAFVSRLFDMYGAMFGKPLVGEKTPKYVTQLATLTGLWPAARVVHVIRDGRDVALSLRDWDKAERNVGRFAGFTDDPITGGALYWEWSVRSGREARSLVGAGYHELLYEQLIADPERTCGQMSAFLGLAFEPAMLEFHEGRSQSRSNGSAKKTWQPITSGLRDWRSEMSPGEIRRFEAVAGDLLDELGYERAAARARGRDARPAEASRAAFVGYLQRSGRVIPSAWRERAA